MVEIIIIECYFDIICGMDFSEMIRQRYSVRKYDSRPVEDDKLRTVLEAARVAPTAKDTQPFKIYVVKSKGAIERLRAITPMAFDAPVVIMVGAVFDECCQSPFSGKDYSYIDTSIVTDHMMLQAQALGLGTCWVGYFDPKLISKEFDIPEGIEIKHLLPIGYPATDSVPGPMHSKRKSLEELVVEL